MNMMYTIRTIILYRGDVVQTTVVSRSGKYITSSVDFIEIIKLLGVRNYVSRIRYKCVTITIHSMFWI